MANDEPKFTQADVDKIVAERLGRREKQLAKQLKALEDELDRDLREIRLAYVLRIAALYAKH